MRYTYGRVLSAEASKLPGGEPWQQMHENSRPFEQPLETGQIAHPRVSLSGRAATQPRQVKRKQIRWRIYVYD